MLLSIPDAPPSPNVLRRKYRDPRAYKKLRDSWALQILAEPCLHHRNELRAWAKAKTRVSVQITVYHPRQFDDDNLAGAQKPVLDAMVNVGFLSDDSPTHLDLQPPVQVQSKEVKTVISIRRADHAES
jgi:Holliday junction resolvase RusA-like endonuclease